jgi:hypothetical protein
MSASESVSGQEKLNIFKALEKETILLNVRLLRTGLTQLAVIKRLTSQNEDWFFLIECSQRFKERISTMDNWGMAFAFIGEQGIHYRFKTVGGKFIGGCDMLIRVPDAIDRFHRRKHFRIKAHPAARLKAKIDGREAVMKLIDISQGGALVMFADKEQENRMMAAGQALTDLRIKLLPGEKDAAALRVKQAEVRSVALEPNSGTFHFGIMFVDLSKLEEKLIKERIYVDERQMLRKKGA